MKKSKCVLSLIMAAAMAFPLVACDNKQGTTPNGGANGGATGGSSDVVSIFSRPTVERPAEGRKDWLDVDSFVCYYGSLTGDSEENPVFGGEPRRALDVLKEFDVAIIHSTQIVGVENSREYIQELKDAGTYVIAYISIGEDDGLKVADGLGGGGYASYYIYENGLPKQNGNWGTYFVDGGNPIWQDMVLSRAKAIVDYGVDGLFLDTLDTVDIAYHTIGGMVDLVRRLDEELPEGTKLVPNRGFTIFPYISQYVDGIMFESFYTNWDADAQVYMDRSPEELEYNINIACNVINAARRYDYMPVFALDYINRPEYKYMPQEVYNIVWQYDFIPYCTYDRMLHICPNPGVKPTSKRGELALSKLKEDDGGEAAINGDTSANNLAYAGNGLVTVTVDSTFPGYSGAKPLNDGFYATKENHDQNKWATEAWASADDTKKDHWIQFTFSSPQDISKMIVYWAVDNGTIFSARKARVEAWIGEEWVTVATYDWYQNGEFLTQQQLTEFTFTTVKTDRIRVVQPKGMGDATSSRLEDGEAKFSGIMWVSEVAIYA